MVTTIQLNENVKNHLENLKQDKESYEEVIVRILKTLEQQKRQQEALLIESCKVMAEENLKITKEFESIEELENWEW